jgi:hypothetical protein
MMTFSEIARMFSLGVLDFIHSFPLDYLTGSDQEYDGAVGWSFDFHIGWMMKDEM